MKNQTEKTKLSTSTETLTFGNDSSLIIKKSVGAGDYQTNRKNRISNELAEDTVFYLNHNLLLLEREVAFFNFAIQEVTDLVS